jgi:hypothetical protein
MRTRKPEADPRLVGQAEQLKKLLARVKQIQRDTDKLVAAAKRLESDSTMKRVPRRSSQRRVPVDTNR